MKNSGTFLDFEQFQAVENTEIDGSESGTFLAHKWRQNASNDAIKTAGKNKEKTLE